MGGMSWRHGDHMKLSLYRTMVGIHVLCGVLMGTLSAATTTTTMGPTISTTVLANTQDTITVTPQSLPSIDTSFSNVTLRKCRCERDEMWSGDHCVEKITVVPCLGPEGPFARNTSAFSKVSIGDPVCKEGFTTVPLYSYEYLVFLTPDGTLLWENENMLIEDYCIEHNLYEDGIEVIQVQACIPPPPVPQCCPSGYILGDDESCHPDTDNNVFTPPVYVSNQLMQWQGLEEDVVNITCSADENVTHVNLTGGDGWLLYSHQQAVLHLGTPLKSNNILHYCVAKMKGSDSSQPEYTAKLCTIDPILKHQTMCSNSTCVRKCCPEGFLLMDNTCVEATNDGERWQPFFHDYKDLSVKAAPREDWTVVYGLPLCSNFFSLVPKDREVEKFYLLTNGSLHVPLFTNSFLPKDYCMDLNLDKEPHPTGTAIICSFEITEECRWKQTLIAVLRGVSSVFLAATVLIYLGVPDLRDRTNGRCLVSMALAMIASHLSIIIVNEMPLLNDIECFTVAFVGHVNTLATFFWLSVMCFDMWSTLRTSQQQYHSLKIFGFYSLYAWGCPLLIGLVGLVLDIIKPPDVIRPNFTEGTCWFTGNAEFWTYLSGIILILVVLNLFFFIHTAVLLSQKLKERKAMVFDGNKSKTKEQVWLYVKLFIVMGVMWVTDILSSLHHRNECQYWVLTDIINALQGVFIFMVAICNKDNLKKIRKQLRTAWYPRVERVRKTMLTLRRTSTPANSHSLSASDASRKTSITSVPRKLSAVSNHLITIGNKNKTTAVIDENDECKKSLETSPSNKLSASTSENIPMSTLAE